MHKQLKFKFHGNYGGPQYCGGEFGDDCDYSVEPVDSLDHKFRAHDMFYERGETRDGDLVLLESLKSERGVKASLAAYGFAAKSAYNHITNPIQRRNDLVRVAPTNRQMHAINGNVRKNKQKVLQPVVIKAKVKRRQPTYNGAAVQGSALAKSFSKRNDHYMAMHPIKDHKEYGPGGCLLRGRQYVCAITTTATNTFLLVQNGGADVAANEIVLSPDRLNLRLAAMATWYSLYRFRRVRISYMPVTAATDTGGFAMAYTPDGNFTSHSVMSYLGCINSTPSCWTAFRNECSLDITYGGDKVWYTEYIATTGADIRQTAQGVISAYPSATSIGAINHGHWFIDYELELFGPCTTLGFILLVPTREKRDHFKKLLAEEEEKKDDDVKCDLTAHVICTHCKS